MDFLIRVILLIYEILSLWIFYDFYELNICGLEVFDVKIDMYGCFFILIFLKKLLEFICYVIFRFDSLVDKLFDKLWIVFWWEIEIIEKGCLLIMNSYEIYDEELFVLIMGMMLFRM